MSREAQVHLDGPRSDAHRVPRGLAIFSTSGSPRWTQRDLMDSSNSQCLQNRFETGGDPVHRAQA
jgi:hypothetical protein